MVVGNRGFVIWNSAIRGTVNPALSDVLLSDKSRFLSVGSVFYALYFVVRFPMFFELDDPQRSTNYPHNTQDRPPVRHVSLKHVMYNVFAACAIVTLLLGLWRLFIGIIYDIGSAFAEHSELGVSFIH